VTHFEIVAEHAVLPHACATRARIVVRDGRIESVDTNAPSKDARVVKGTLLPGFVDLQVNGGGGASCAEATPAALDACARACLEGGATAFLPTLITTPWNELLRQVEAVARWIESKPKSGALPLGIHVEGPFLEVAGAHDADSICDPTEERIAQLLAAGRGAIRLVTLASSKPGASRATAKLREHGITVAIGHVSNTEGFAACVDAGASMATHLFNAMGAIHHRNPGIAGFTLDERRLSCGLIVDGVHVHPAMLRNAMAVLGQDRAVLVTDATAAMGMPDGEFLLAQSRVTSKGGVVRDSKGSLAGSALTMSMAAKNFLAMVPDAGPFALARIASANPAALIGAADYGTIAVGKRAAFTVLADDGSCTSLTF
jgi:N-acetylglucosamine-6-phosphate deacetylase